MDLEVIANRFKMLEDHEARENHFRNLAGLKHPRRHLGPKAFISDFGTACTADNQFVQNGDVRLCVTSNPRDWLAHRTVEDTLLAAESLALDLRDSHTFSFGDAVEFFGLNHLIESRICSISAGEAALTAMAKCLLLSDAAALFCVSSPFSWLSSESIKKFQGLHQIMETKCPVIDYLGLDGDLDATPFESFSNEDNVPFDIKIKNLSAGLGVFGLELGDSTSAHFSNFKADLLSPCLIIGENGSGKSLLASLLSGAMTHKGRVHLSSRTERGKSRMMFQDTERQAMSRSILGFQRCYGSTWKDVEETYTRILNIAMQLAESAGERFHTGPQFYEGPLTLAQKKLLLASARLAGNILPTALIMDEPSWGLTRIQTRSIVGAIINHAHSKGIPVIIVSHRPWWQNIAVSKIALKKQVQKDGNLEFTIKQESIN